MTTASESRRGPAAHVEIPSIGARSTTTRLNSLRMLYGLTFRQHLHGRRWIAVALLFLLPGLMAILIRAAHAAVPNIFLEFVLVWMLIPQALLPLAAILYASGIIQDEQEDQTITYLLIRPISKWWLYGVKMAATWTTTVFLVLALTLVTFAAIYAGSGLGFKDIALRCAAAGAILSLAAIAYCSIFGAISLFTRRTLVVGIIYVALIEGLLASFPLSLRWGTVIYYTRILAYRSLDFLVTWPRGRESDVASMTWVLNTDTDPQMTEHPQLLTCVLVLLFIGVVFTAIAGWVCKQREFHVKTPEKD